MPRPTHLGRPPSACGKATIQSAWVPDGEAGATCRHCLGLREPVIHYMRTDPLARALTEWRCTEGMLQSEVAATLGFSRATWNSYETGRAVPNQRTLLALVAVWPSAQSFLTMAV